MSISSAPSRNRRSSAPGAAICAALRPPAPGTKPTSSAPRRGGMQDRKAVPAVAAADLRGPRRKRSDGCAIRPRQRAHTDDHHWPLGLFEYGCELMRARRDICERLRPSAEIIVAIGEIGALADQADRKGAHAPALADARVEHGRFAARIGGD